MKKVLILLTMLLVGFQVQAQVAINSTGAAPDPSAVLDISHDIFNPGGLLIPRMDFLDILAIPDPAIGLMVYDTLTNRFWYYTGMYWDRVGDGHWIDAGPGIHSTWDHVGIGTFADILYGLKINHHSATGIAAYSGSETPGQDPITPSAIFGLGTGGHNGAEFIADSTGTALTAESTGTGHAAKLKGGNVYIEKYLGIGTDNPGAPLVAKNLTGEITGQFASMQNTLVTLIRDGTQGGFLQIFNNGELNDFYLGKAINHGAGAVHLYNQGKAFTLKNSGTFSFSNPTPASSMLIEMRRAGDQDGFIQIYDDLFNSIPNVMVVGKATTTGDLRFENNGNYIVMEPDGDVGIGTNAGLTFPPIPNKLRIESDNTAPCLSSNVTYSGNNDVRAIEGISTPAPGYGYGGWFKGGYYGLYSEAAGSSYGGDAIGVYAKATGSTGTRIGLHASASGGTTNWAAWFPAGNVYVASDVRIGTTTGASGYKLSVDGKIIGEELKIQDAGAWPDYVFEDSYKLMSLEEVEKSIQMNKHLPGIPSAKEVAKNGIMVGDMQKKMMEKIEELTLHMISMQKRINELESALNEKQ